MTRALISPADYDISNANYGKSYNLLEHFQSDTLDAEAYVSKAEHRPQNPSVSVHELGAESRVSYYLRALSMARKRLRAGSFDVYHHMNLSYRWFNPALLLDLLGDVPVVVGPCQPGHGIYQQEFNRAI